MDMEVLLAVGAGLGIAAATAYCLTTSSKPKGVLIGNAADVEPGKMKEVKVDDKTSLLLVKTAKGKLHAVGSKCTHYKAPMVQGVLSGNHITCPWHAACFDVTTGDIEDGPVFDKLPVFPLTVTKDGSVYAELPADRTKMRSEVPHMCPTSSGDRRNFVIIGSGPAALAAAEALRQEGYAGRITMLTKEASVPYDRVKLSKNLAVTADEAALRPLSFFTEHGISLRTGVVVTEVRTATKEVVLAGGETVRYDKLLAATGGNPRTFRRGEEGAFAHDGGELRNIFPLRDAPHAAIVNELLNSVGPAARVVIIGASFIGMEFAAYLQMNTKIRDITVVAMEEVPFERTMGKTVGTFMMGLHAAKGIKFEMKAQVDCFLEHGSRKGEVGAVKLKSGTVIPCDLVLAGVGVYPAVGYLRGAQGVELLAAAPGGVKVDASMRAGEDVYAAGDIAYFPYQATRAYADPKYPSVRIEHWAVAIDQGRVAGRNMAGKACTYDSVPFFWTQQYGRSVRCAGYATDTSNIIVKGEMKNEASSWMGFYKIADRIAAVVTYNRDPQAVAAQELLRLNAMPSVAEVERLDIDLVEYLREYNARKAAAAQ